MSIIRRIVGLLLVIAAIGGLLISIGGIVALWNVEPNLAANLQNTLTLLSDTLDTTSKGLIVTNDALRASVATIGNMQTTLETTAMTIESTNPMVDDIALLMSQELPNTILATQQSLTTAQQSAQVIDGLLGSLSAIPLIGSGIGYDPEVPLSEALGQVAASLETLPDAFISMEENLRNTQTNLETFTTDMTAMATSVGQIQSSVAQYEQVVNGYAASIDQIKNQMATLSAQIPQITRSVVWGLTAFLLWMAIAQLGLFTQGWELLTERGQRELVEDIIEEVKEEESEVVIVKEEVEKPSSMPAEGGSDTQA